MTLNPNFFQSSSSDNKVKIGIIRSAPTQQIVIAVKLLREKNSNSHISVIMQESYIPESAEYLCDNIIFSHKNGPFGLFSIGLKKIFELRREQFDLLILPYNNPDGIHCWNIEFLAFLIGGEKWIVDNNGKIYPLKSVCWIKNILFKRMPRSFSFLILLIMFFPLIFIALLFSFLTRSKKKSYDELIKYGG